MPKAGVSGLAVFYGVSGGVLLWSGFKGQTVAQTIRAIVSGDSAALSQHGSEAILTANIIPAAAGTAPVVSAAAGANSVSGDAVQYEGHAYRYGGAPGPSGKNPWDCSSFCNWVLGHDLGMKLPGSSSAGYSGASHGPNTVMYLVWGGATTVSHKASDARPGDLLVWQTHMGISLGGGQMISALNERLGTKTTSVSGGSPGGELLYVRRIKG